MIATGKGKTGPGIFEWDVEATAGKAAFDALAPEWLQLWREAGEHATPFVHPQWVRAHATTMENPGRLVLFSARREGRLGAVLPLIRERGWYYGLPVRRLRSAASVHSVRFDLCALAGEAGRQAARAIGENLLQRRDWDVIELREAPSGGVAEAIVEAAQAAGRHTGSWKSVQSPIVQFAGNPNWEQYLKAHHRNDIRRTIRRLEQDGPPGATVRFRRLEWNSPEELQFHLEEYYRLEADGWKGRRGSDILSRGVRSFYDQACTAMAAEGCLVLYRLELGDERLAMACCLEHGGSQYVLKWSYDERFSKYGVGMQLCSAVLRDCAAAGLRAFDFTAADEGYKARWTPLRLSHAWLFVFQRGFYGRVLWGLKCRVAPRAGRWLEQLKRWSKRRSG